ncbi:hypothetical protein HPB50_015001 [Hyalomma asiaticum]|uniref:Uncharacterized protein n=1 Tax=Hyalomma asiaticum TaxID=266040 RepID=A0ACB7SQB5_HYAAI|nr:hypothetical protein HPB50_015001 [Hyalomma asiaticum]
MAPFLSTLVVSNRAERGEDDEIQAMGGTEWHVVQSKSAKKKQAVERGIPDAPRSSHDCVQFGAASPGITAIQASSDLVCPNVVQNIVVVCTEKEDNAGEIFSQEHSRQRQRAIGDTELESLIHIKDTGSVVVLLNGGDVQCYIRVGQATVRCYLYKKQMEVRSKCTRFGHRADVCPTPMVNVCHNCGPKDPE